MSGFSRTEHMLKSLGHYKILDRIGAGRIGDVYKARDTKLGRTVTIEVLSPEVARDRARRERFLRDARAATLLSHPNIAAIYEVGEEEGLTYLVCEFVPGEPLTTIIANRSLNPRRAVEVATQLADAVADAHAEGITHRNLKSIGVVVTPKDKVKVIGFGLAAWMKRGGTPAPPALSQEADYGGDIFSLGVLLYEMLTGRQPLASPGPPSLLNPNVPRELDPIALKALSKVDGGGYESAATLAAELRALAAILDVRSGGKEPLVLAPARRRRPVARTWLVALLILAAFAGLVWLATRAGGT